MKAIRKMGFNFLWGQGDVFWREWIWLICIVLAILGQVETVQSRETPYFGIGLYIISGILFTFFTSSHSNSSPSFESISIRRECLCLAGILIVAAFFRTYQLDILPPGLRYDEGFTGFGALEILYKGWRPFAHVEYNFNAPSLLLYCLAGWFNFFQPTQIHFYLFFVLNSLAGLLLVYWTFRQIAGSQPALIGLYILAVMFWHVQFSRNGYPNMQIIFYMFGTLSFFLHGLRVSKFWPFLASALFFGLGLWTYQSYKVFPLLMLALLIYEFWKNPEPVLKNSKNILIFFVISLTLMSPVIQYWIQSGSLGIRENHLLVFNKMVQQKSLSPLLENIKFFLLMFNWKGDQELNNNIPGHRMLDDASGILFVFGVLLAFRRRKERSHFYCLCGLAIMSLPGLLGESVPAHRIIGILPFLALASANAFQNLLGFTSKKWGLGWRSLKGGFATIALVWMMTQNYLLYFKDYAGQCGLPWYYSEAVSDAGKKTEEWRNQYHFFVSRELFHDFTFRFFTFFQQDRIKPLSLLDSLALGEKAPGEARCFILDKDQGALMDYFKKVFPEGRESTHLDRCTSAPIIFYDQLAPEAMDRVRGLKGRIFNDPAPRVFNEFPSGLPSGPYEAKFKGALFIDQNDTYRFDFRGRGNFSLNIGGHPITPGKKMELIKGFYPLTLRARFPAGSPDFSVGMTPADGKRIMIDASRLCILQLWRGLKATFYSSLDCTGKPLDERWDPIICYTNGNDFPGTPIPKSVRWTGQLHIPQSGLYRFIIVTDEKASLRLGSQRVILPGFNSTPPLYLKKGECDLEMSYSRVFDYASRISLRWIKPGEISAEVIPNEAFGKVQ